jgi:hypothetical protein
VISYALNSDKFRFELSFSSDSGGFQVHWLAAGESNWRWKQANPEQAFFEIRRFWSDFYTGIDSRPNNLAFR